MNEWISVKDQEPPKDGRALMLCWAIDADGQLIDWNKQIETSGVFVQVASWWGEEEGWIVYCGMIQEPRLHFKPTHWMPLPEPPRPRPSPAPTTGPKPTPNHGEF